jgi:cyanophycinase
VTASRRARGTLALVGGGEFDDACLPLHRQLLTNLSPGAPVVVVPTAAAFEHPDRVVAAATAHFAALDATVVPLMALSRRDAEDDSLVKLAKSAQFIYIADGSPLHLRSVLKDSSLFAVIAAAYRNGAVLAASGAGATLVGDPMVDPRGGAYTVGLGLAPDLAVFPYHGTAADHMRDRSIDLLPDTAVLAGLDEHTALVRDPEGVWRVVGPGAVTVYAGSAEPRRYQDSVIEILTI